MTADVRQMLQSVVDEVMGHGASTAFVGRESEQHDWVATVESGMDRSRAVVLRATPEWFSLHIEGLDVGATAFDYDGDQDEKRATLHGLALVGAAYLEGLARVDVRPRRFWRPARVTLTVDVGGQTWVLRRRSHSVMGGGPRRDWC